MSLQQFCKRPVFSVSPGDTILKACQLMEEHNVGCLVAEEKGKICGILTDRDIALKVAGEQKDSQDTRVADVMSRDPISMSMDKGVHELTAFMHTHHVRRVPIVDGAQRVVGIVTLDDLIALLGDELWDMGKTVSEARVRATA
jgi:CBS domain-containing protein